MGGLVYTPDSSSDGSIVHRVSRNPSLQHSYNMPNATKNGTFEVNDSDPVDIPGPYTSGGQTLSYCQPHDLGPISSILYAPGIPSSTNYQTYQNTRLFNFVSFGRLPQVVVVHCQLILQ
jgi:hypothetical protein